MSERNEKNESATERAKRLGIKLPKPHTIDAQVWADEWLRTIAANPNIPTDRETMIGWFANAIMAGYDTAEMRAAKRDPVRESQWYREALDRANAKYKRGPNEW